MVGVPQRGDFVRVRSRRWLVEDERPIDGLKTLRLACVDDDAQGEVAEVLWDAEIDGEVLGDEGWASVANLGTDDPSVFSAYFRTLRWNTATAADRDLTAMELSWRPDPGVLQVTVVWFEGIVAPSRSADGFLF